MAQREQIISFLKSKGPSVPNDIKRALGGDTVIFGAMLSEQISRGSVLITKVKKGSSPFYYLPGQEKQLEKLIEFCNPKDQKTIALLKEKQVLRDQTLELFERVSLRQIPDFAKELKVNTAQGEMMFWRYFLVSEEAAIEILKQHYNKTQPKHQPRVETPLSPSVEEKVVEKKVVEKKVEEKTVEQPVVPTPRPVVKAPEPKSVPLQESQQQLATPSQTTTQATTFAAPTPLDKTEFHSLILRYFGKSNIEILSQEQISKNREYEFILKVPSALGTMEMYARARNKKKLNEGDVAPALLKAKTKDLPCIFLTNGEFTKKSLLIIEKEYKGLLIKKLS